MIRQLLLVFCCLTTLTGIAETTETIVDPLADVASTDGHIHITNLAHQIQYLRDRLARENNNNLPRLYDLAEALWQQGLIFSDLNRIGEALQVADQIVAIAPSDSRGFLLRARLKMSLHQFQSAQHELNQAQRFGAPLHQIHPLSAEIQLNLGKMPSTLVLADINSSTASWLTQVTVLMHNKQYGKAMSAMHQAMNLIRNPNPLPMVALYLLWAELAERQNNTREHAYALKMAVARLPFHVAALESLSAYHLKNGEIDQAIGLLQSATEQSSDPHLLVQLAKAYRTREDINRALNLEKTAKQSFENLLRSYPEAYAAEAADFFMTLPDQLEKSKYWAEVAVTTHPIPANRELLLKINKKLKDLSADPAKKVH